VTVAVQGKHTSLWSKIFLIVWLGPFSRWQKMSQRQEVVISCRRMQGHPSGEIPGRSRAETRKQWS